MKLLKFEAEGREFAKILRSLEKFCWNNTFLNFLMEVLFRSNTLEQTIGMQKSTGTKGNFFQKV